MERTLLRDDQIREMLYEDEDEVEKTIHLAFLQMMMVKSTGCFLIQKMIMREALMV